MLKVFTSQGPVSADTLSGLLAKVRAVLSRGPATERADPPHLGLEGRQPDGTCERCRQIARDWPGASLDTLHRSHGRVETLEAYADQQARGRTVGLVGGSAGGGKSAWLSDDARRRRLERHLVSQGFSTERARSLAGENRDWLSYYLGTCGIGAAGLPQEPAWFRTEGGRPLAPVIYDECSEVTPEQWAYLFDKLGKPLAETAVMNTCDWVQIGLIRCTEHTAVGSRYCTKHERIRTQHPTIHFNEQQRRRKRLQQKEISMKREFVTVDGIELTRTQVEEATRQLALPTALDAGTTVSVIGMARARFIVPSEGVQGAVAREGVCSPNEHQTILICTVPDGAYLAGRVYKIRTSNLCVGAK